MDAPAVKVQVLHRSSVDGGLHCTSQPNKNRDATDSAGRAFWLFATYWLLTWVCRSLECSEADCSWIDPPLLGGGSSLHLDTLGQESLTGLVSKWSCLTLLGS